MASSCSSSYGSSQETTNFARICRIVVDILRDVLWQVLINEIPPADLANKVQTNLNKLGKLEVKIKTWLCGISPTSPEIPIADKFDVSSLYTLIRNLCSQVPTPSTQWGKTPPPGGTNLGDDIERVRAFRNTLYGHATQAKIDTADFNTLCTDIKNVVGRLDVYFSSKAMKCDFKSEIDTILTCSMDKILEDAYIDKMKEIVILSDDFGDVKQQVGFVKRQVRMLNQQVGHVKQQVDNVYQKVGDVKLEVGSVKQEVGDVKQEVVNVKDQVGIVKQEVGNVDRNVGDVKQEVGNVKQEVGKINQNVGDVKQEVGNVKQEVVNVNWKVGDVKQEVGNVKQQVGSVNQHVGDIKQEVGNVKEKVCKINQNVGNVKQEVGNVNRKVGYIKQEVGNVKHQVRNVNQQVGDIKQEVGSVKEEVGKINQEVGNVKQEVGNVNRKVGNVTQEVSNVNLKVGNVKQEVGNVRQEVGNVKQEVGSVNEKVGDVKLEVGSVKQQVTNVNQQVGDVKEEVSNVKQQVGSVKKNVKILQDKVDVIKKEIAKQEDIEDLRNRWHKTDADIAEIKETLKKKPDIVEKGKIGGQDLQTKEFGLASGVSNLPISLDKIHSQSFQVGEQMPNVKMGASPFVEGYIDPEADKQEPVIPLEIRRMDEESIRLFKEALRDRTVKVYNIRVMLVGQYGVGKTTLCKRLLGDDVNICERKSTEGIDVHVHRCRVSLETGEWVKQDEDAEQADKVQRYCKLLNDQSQGLDIGNEQAGYSNPMHQAETALDVKESDIQHLESTNLGKDRKRVKSSSRRSDLSYEDQSNDGDKKGLKASSKVMPGKKKKIKSNISKEDLRQMMEQSVRNADMSDNEDTVKNILKFLNENADKLVRSREEYSPLAMWDFAGQYVYYTTHQTFLTHRAIYLLVIDLTQQATAQVMDDDCFFDIEGKKECQVHDLVELWMNSIHSCAPSLESGSPPVILVGTHMDKIEQDIPHERSENVFRQIRSYYLRGRPARHHLADMDFSIDNTIEDPKIRDLQKKIVELASQQPHWGESIPGRWLPLEERLMSLKAKGVKVIAYHFLEKMNQEGDVKIESKKELDLFLKFQHDIGNILYFRVSLALDDGHRILADPGVPLQSGATTDWRLPPVGFIIAMRENFSASILLVT